VYNGEADIGQINAPAPIVETLGESGADVTMKDWHAIAVLSQKVR
jgi:hypothetical protein